MRSLLIILALFTGLATVSAQQPKSAEAILKEGYAEAKKEKKNLFVMFHASWCGWCHLMDTSMNDASVKKYFDKSFVIKHIVVSEAKDKKNLETPGGMEMLQKYHAADQGIPLWLVFDAKGTLLGDSQQRPDGVGLDQPGKNVGCPATQEEVDHFIKVLKVSTTLKEDELAAIAARFRKNDRGH
ncbi:thioredoxin family protein [Pseudoflavitalea sp. G-6-1-2]|uniref:thioredoxin family protein n=1 Tax=Pseudoflavitalea sp. G-6-1-2 TaxID=2728841 RepID=UPI00146ACC3C|nr:thioredoxin family protein [Pseudoflavitalea sp. G-6-1-2]NML21103.1 thioredoxin family protein [Pseudoflavitalea sp. G-6-1-2]